MTTKNYLSTRSLKSNFTYIISHINIITCLYYYNSYIYYLITILCLKSYQNLFPNKKLQDTMGRIKLSTPWHEVKVMGFLSNRRF